MRSHHEFPVAMRKSRKEQIHLSRIAKLDEQRSPVISVLNNRSPPGNGNLDSILKANKYELEDMLMEASIREESEKRTRETTQRREQAHD